jgi:hypothetical protein
LCRYPNSAATDADADADNDGAEALALAFSEEPPAASGGGCSHSSATCAAEKAAHDATNARASRGGGRPTAPRILASGLILGWLTDSYDLPFFSLF